eukprot:scaffold229337_cov33-Tisochrysis_lutea.AAC.2
MACAMSRPIAPPDETAVHGTAPLQCPPPPAWNCLSPRGLELAEQFAMMRLTLALSCLPCLFAADVTTYATKQWDWDEAKFQLKTPLRELAETISGKIGGLEEELKVKLSDLNTLKGSLQAFERRTQGNLMVRGLGDIVQEDDILDSEYMTTVMVVIQKSMMKEFLLSYEKLADYVVPLSAKAISEDSEYVLFGVTLFKKSLEQFKNACREKRFAVRDFTFDAEQVAADEAKRANDESEYSRQNALLANWCAINYSEALIMFLHLKAIRVFIESVLRYGLIAYRGQGMAPNMQAVILQPKKGKVEVLRKALNTMFMSSSASADTHEEVVVPGSGGDFYPYVSVTIAFEPPAL